MFFSNRADIIAQWFLIAASAGKAAESGSLPSWPVLG
jgi:hypothetical protein